MDDGSTAGMHGTTRKTTKTARVDHNARRFLWGVPGTMLTLSVIGAPVGLWMLKNARVHQGHLLNGKNPHSQTSWSDVVWDLGALAVDGATHTHRDDQ